MKVKSKTFAIIVVILAILLIGALIYFFVNRNNNDETDNQLINKLPEGDTILNIEMDDNQPIDENILNNMVNDVE